MISPSHQLAVRQLRELHPDVRLIVVHPNYLKQHPLLSELLQENAVYVRFDGSRLMLEQLQTQIDSHRRAQLDETRFDSRFDIILDECDRAVPKDFVVLLNTLLAETSGRIIVFTRQLPKGLLGDDYLRRQMAFVPTGENTMLWDYANHRGQNTMLLEVTAFGAGRVMMNGQPVDSWDGALPRALFFYFVDRGMVTRAEIFDTFWPNLSVREATNVFHVTKRKISEVLKTDLTEYNAGFYHIAQHLQLSYDVSLFNKLVQDSAMESPEQAVSLLNQALTLYRGDFLTGQDSEWVKQRRQDLRLACCDALVSLGRLVEGLDDQRRALGLYLWASSTQRYRDDLAHNIMQLYRALGMRADALRVYGRLRDELQASLGVKPARHIEQLAQTLEAEIDGGAA